MSVAAAVGLGTLRSHYKRILSVPVLVLPETFCLCRFNSLFCPGPPLGMGFYDSSKHASVHTSAASPAGHNKWSKVKHIKGPKDEARAQLFAKLSMKIKLAVKEGGPNPEFNPNLAQLVEQCRARNMPKTSLDAAIKVADKGKGSSYVLYEGRGPGGSALLIEAITDNSKRVHQAIKYIMSRNGGTLCDGARHCFNKKGVIVVRCEDNKNQAVELDRAVELAIESGAEDVTEVEDEEENPVLKFICEIPLLREVRAKLVSLGLISLSMELEFIPNTTVSLSDAEMEHASQLLRLINSLHDVVRIYDNIE